MEVIEYYGECSWPSLVLFSYLLRGNYFHESHMYTYNPDIYIFNEKYVSIDLLNKYLLTIVRWVLEK